MDWEKLTPSLQAAVAQQRLPKAFLATLHEYYLPLTEQITHLHNRIVRPLVIGINGAQGTGKSTLAEFLRIMLSAGGGLSCVVLSIDDFYLTHEQRRLLAQQVHPLLQTRGVPGTHDVELALRTIEQLTQATTQTEIKVPRFDKSIDDRQPEANWDLVTAPADIVLFEGWCVSARAEADAALAAPVNALERNDDSDGSWRRYVNQTLATDYRALFTNIDYLLMLKAPSFDCVIEWRWLQEQKLAAATTSSENRLMTRPQLQRFIQHYERITRHTLAEMTHRADCVFALGEDHQIMSVNYASKG